MAKFRRFDPRNKKANKKKQFANDNDSRKKQVDKKRK